MVGVLCRFELTEQVGKSIWKFDGCEQHGARWSESLVRQRVTEKSFGSEKTAEKVVLSETCQGA